MEITIYSPENQMPLEVFKRVFAILEYSFPETERRGFSEHFAELKKSSFRSAVISENGEIRGFINFRVLSRLIFIEHFAIASEFRKKGLGTAALKELLSKTGNFPVILEVEPAKTSETARRRIEFYKRLEFFENNGEYYQPPFGKDGKPLRLMLLSYPERLSDGEFYLCAEVIYREAYETDFRLPRGAENSTK